MTADTHRLVEDDDTLQRRTKGKDAMSLVILFLFAHKEKADRGIVHHKLNLLLTARGIEWDSHSPHPPCSKVAIQILGTVI